MAQITSSVGLVSGLNTGLIIQELLSLDSQPVTLLQNRVTSANAQSQAFQVLGTQLSQLQQIGQSLELPTSFANATATSSDPSVLSATASVGAAVGSYDFQVVSLVTSQQAISNGYTSPSALVGAGTISISQGGGEASSQTTLAQLNGGAGVQRGQFRITDGGGNSAVIDLSDAVHLDDVVNKINSSLNISVKATIKDNHLVLQDASGQNKSNFSVADLGNGTAAEQLGIVNSTSGTTITGASINTITNNTPLSQLNDGRGIGTAGGASDFQVNLSDGSNVQVTVGATQTIGDILTAINKAGGSKFKAQLDPAANGIKIVDNTIGTSNFSVAALNNSTAASDLGIAGTTTGASLGGKTLLASLDSVLVSSLNGGTGIPLGTVRITDRTGRVADINLANDTSVQNILDSLNGAGLKINASLNNARDGIQFTDTSGAGGNLVVSDVNSTSAKALGILGTFDPTQSVVTGTDLHTQYIAANTLLSTFNGGKGVEAGAFTITNSKGATATLNLGSGTFNTVGDVIGAINAKNLGVTASINANGDGIQLVDSAGGASKLKVADINGGTAASDLNIAGAATANTIDGSLTKTITVTAGDTLTTLQQKINTANAGVGVTIVNDGSGNNGYHLAITARDSGRSGRFVFDAGATSLSTQNVVNAQDAAVFYGGANAVGSLLVTSSSNQVTGIVPGVTIQLQSTGSSTLNVALDASSISTQLSNFTQIFNGLVAEINTLTQFNTTTHQSSLLLGDSTVQNIQQQLYNVIGTVVNGAGQYRQLADLGVSFNQDGTIAFDQNKFATAYATNPNAIQNLFTQTTTGLGTTIDKTLGRLVDPVDGSVTLAETTLSNQVQGFQNQINNLNVLLDDQRNTLQSEFNNMEVVLSGLQSQGTALASIGSFETSLASTAATASKSSSSSSGH